MLGSAVLILPVFALFLTIGTLLASFYHPPYAAPANRNELFPVFIVTELPAGFRGFVMAGLLAASLSSLTSVLNALASTTINDFYRPWRNRTMRSTNLDHGHFLIASRACTAIWGGVLVLAALAFVGSQDNILNVALSVLTYFYGGLLGTFLLGIFTRRGNAFSITLGMIASVPVVLLLQLRAFAAAPQRAPDSVRLLLEELPPEFSAGIVEHVPAVAWNYWIIIGTAICFAIGVLGRR